ASAKEHDDFCWPSAGEEKSVAQTIALQSAHRPVVKIEGEIADSALLVVTNLAKCAVIGLCICGQRRMRQPLAAHAQSHCRGQLYSAPFAIDLFLEMAYPHRAVDRCDAYRAVALGKELPWRAAQLIFRMRAIEVVWVAKERIQDARRAVGGVYFSCNNARR